MPVICWVMVLALLHDDEKKKKIEKVKKVLWLLKCLHNFDVTIQ